MHRRRLSEEILRDIIQLNLRAFTEVDEYEELWLAETILHNMSNRLEKHLRAEKR